MRRLAYVLIIAAPLFAAPALAPFAAAAVPQCPTNTHYGWMGEEWAPSDHNVTGYRAPIQLRKSGYVCTPNGFSSPWIGVQSTNNTNEGIAQIGWDHESDLGYCRFWEFNNNQGYDSGPVDYNCGADSGGVTVWFKVKQNLGNDGFYYWNIYDCGASTDYTSCTLESIGPRGAYLSPPEGESTEETNYGGSGCVNDFMGSASSPSFFGGTVYPIEGERNYDRTTWSTRAESRFDAAGCGDYHTGSHTDQLIEIYDDRN